MKLLNQLFTVFLVTGFISCNNSKEADSIVHYKGALKNMMHKGDISAKVQLSDLKEIKHLYALGAFENLKGEIQIFDGMPFNTYVPEERLHYDTTFSKNATLLVYASIDKWDSIKIPIDVSTYAELESFIEASAKRNGINTNEPFPFLLEGKIRSFDWHVIDWEDGDMEHSHEKHKKSGLYGTIKNREVEMLGFYSNSHHAIFTHHTTNMHIHFKTVDDQIAGHVDGLILDGKMTLKLPKL